MAKFLIPHRKVDPGHEQRILSNNYARLLGDIKRRMVETESPVGARFSTKKPKSYRMD